MFKYYVIVWQPINAEDSRFRNGDNVAQINRITTTPVRDDRSRRVCGISCDCWMFVCVSVFFSSSFRICTLLHVSEFSFFFFMCTAIDCGEGDLYLSVIIVLKTIEML